MISVNEMDINDNIVIEDEEVFDGSCDLCWKQFSSYDKLKNKA